MNIPASYKEFTRQMQAYGYRRIERDDRILDVFSSQTREKGVELWEKTQDNQVNIIRLRLPYNPKKTETFSIPRLKLETALQSNTQLNLNDF